jgi:hypothetical protein
MAMSYDRLMMAGLAVLFVQSLANHSDRSAAHGRYVILGAVSTYNFTAAFLLNMIFLIKISGLVVGVGVVLSRMFVCCRIN